jgi:hypothetical protein
MCAKAETRIATGSLTFRTGRALATSASTSAMSPPTQLTVPGRAEEITIWARESTMGSLSV